jgi:dihydropyrimidinase
MLVLPGCVDIHAQAARVTPPLDDFLRGSPRPVAGGVTTVCDFAAAGRRLLLAAARTARRTYRAALVDYTFPPCCATRTTARSPAAVAAAGAGLKVFMNAARFDHRADRYIRALDAAGRAGIVTAIHPEDASIIGLRTAELLAAGKRGVEFYPDSRPVLAEVIAVRRAIAFAEATGAPIYLVHLSSAAAIEPVAAAKRRGLPVFAETRPSTSIDRGRRSSRSRRRGALTWASRRCGRAPDVEAIWDALRGGALTPFARTLLLHRAEDGPTLEQPHPTGASNLERCCRCSTPRACARADPLPRLVALLATNPARIAGLAPRKVRSPRRRRNLVVFGPDRTHDPPRR